MLIVIGTQIGLQLTGDTTVNDVVAGLLLPAVFRAIACSVCKPSGRLTIQVQMPAVVAVVEQSRLPFSETETVALAVAVPLIGMVGPVAVELVAGLRMATVGSVAVEQLAPPML